MDQIKDQVKYLILHNARDWDKIIITLSNSWMQHSEEDEKSTAWSERSTRAGGNWRHLAHFGFNERSKRAKLGFSFQKVSSPLLTWLLETLQLIHTLFPRAIFFHFT